jgi:hypothetical protein
MITGMGGVSSREAIGHRLAHQRRQWELPELYRQIIPIIILWTLHPHFLLSTVAPGFMTAELLPKITNECWRTFKLLRNFLVQLHSRK